MSKKDKKKTEQKRLIVYVEFLNFTTFSNRAGGAVG